MKHSDQELLLKEILAGNELSSFRQTSVERGLAALHRRSNQRSVLRIAALAALPLLTALALLLHSSASNARRRTLASKSASDVAPSRPREIAKVRFISDEELFALFPDRSMALIGKPGEQELVFLDRKQ